MPGYLALVGFIGESALTTGVQINSLLDNFPISFSEQAFSLMSDVVYSEGSLDGKEISAKNRAAAGMWQQLSEHLKNVKPQFRLLQTAITKGLLGSLVSSLVASVAVYLYDQIVKSYSAQAP